MEAMSERETAASSTEPSWFDETLGAWRDYAGLMAAKLHRAAAPRSPAGNACDCGRNWPGSSRCDVARRAGLQDALAEPIYRPSTEDLQRAYRVAEGELFEELVVAGVGLERCEPPVEP